MTVPWLRLEGRYNSDPRIVRAGFWASIALLGFLTHAKQSGSRKGHVPMADMDDGGLALHMNADRLPGVESVDVTQRLQDSIDDLLRTGLLKIDGTDYVISGWAKHQPDQTKAKRQKDWRANKRRRNEASTGEDDACRHNATERTPGDGNDGDGTGRDGRPYRSSSVPDGHERAGDVLSATAPAAAAAGGVASASAGAHRGEERLKADRLLADRLSVHIDDLKATSSDRRRLCELRTAVRDGSSTARDEATRIVTNGKAPPDAETGTHEGEARA